jgi:hypothetical protein
MLDPCFGETPKGTTVALEVGGYNVIEDKREEVSI